MISFTVIIPSYDRLNYLMDCLDSVSAQRHAPHEVIVIDDGSTDGTVETLEGREGVRLIRQENAGPGAARNVGARAATGDYIAFLDSDDLWFPWSLTAVAQLIEAEKRPALLFARFEDFQDGVPAAAQEGSAQGKVYADFLSAAPDNVFAGAGMMVVDRAAFLAVGGFAEDRLNAEDHDLALRLGTAPGFVQVLAPVIVAHRIHGGNEMGDAAKSLAGMARLVAVERAGGYPGGPAMSRARQAVIARHARAAVVAGLRDGALGAAFSIYRKTLLWQLQNGRFAFLLAVPVLAIRAMFAAPSTPATPG